MFIELNDGNISLKKKHVQNNVKKSFAAFLILLYKTVPCELLLTEPILLLIMLIIILILFNEAIQLDKLNLPCRPENSAYMYII